MKARAGVLQVVIGASRIRAEVLHGGTPTWAGEDSYASLEELTDAIARLAAETPERCRRMTVAVERPPAQLRTLTDIPPVSDRDLTALVAHQAARFFRKNGKPLVTDAVWVGKGPARVAQAVAMEEPLAEAIMSGARAAGLSVERLGPAGAQSDLLLLPGAERTDRLRRRRKRMRTAILATVGLWAAVLGTFIARVAFERRAVERELLSLQRPLATVLDARRAVRVAAATIHAVADAQNGRGGGLAALGGITAALPDSAVLTSLAWNGNGSGMLTGLARSAADVLAGLERGGAVRSPRFEGPVVKEAFAGREWERFTIVFGNGAGP